MQTQHISDIYPNVISINKIRQDIDSLLVLLEQYQEVKVLRGQNVLFRVSRPEIKPKDEPGIRKAIKFANKIAKKYQVKKGQITASEWIMRERERTRKKSFYEKHHR